MLESMLIIFIFISVILFILSVFLLNEEPVLVIPFIMAGIIFSALCIFGFFQVHVPLVGTNSTTGYVEPVLLAIKDQYEPYVWVYMLFIFMYCMLFVKAMFNILTRAAENKKIE